MHDERLFPAELYHGTDRRLVSLSAEERSELRRLCCAISEIAYQRFVDYGMSISNLFTYKERRGESLGSAWVTFCNSFQQYECFRSGSQLYQYDAFYLTTGKMRASNYARSSGVFGELGNNALHLYRSAQKIWDIKHDADLDTASMIECFEEACKHKPDPVILVFSNVPERFLLWEDGKQIEWDFFESSLANPDNINSLRCASGFPIHDYLPSIIEVTW